MTIKRKKETKKVSVPFISWYDYPQESKEYSQLYDFYVDAFQAEADTFVTDKKNDFAYVKLNKCMVEFQNFFYEKYDDYIGCKNLIIDLSGNRGGGSEYTAVATEILCNTDTILSVRMFEKINGSTRKAKATARIYYYNDSAVSQEDKDRYYPFFYNNAFEELDKFLPNYYENEIPDSLRYKGNIYVIVSGVTASAAEIFVTTLAQSAKAKILGKQTNGSLGQPLVTKLPSGITVFINSAKTFDAKGVDISSGIKPDYYYDFSDINQITDPKERLKKYIQVIKQLESKK